MADKVLVIQLYSFPDLLFTLKSGETTKLKVDWLPWLTKRGGEDLLHPTV